YFPYLDSAIREPPFLRLSRCFSCNLEHKIVIGEAAFSHRQRLSRGLSRPCAASRTARTRGLRPLQPPVDGGNREMRGELFCDWDEPHLLGQPRDDPVGP